MSSADSGLAAVVGPGDDRPAPLLIVGASARAAAESARRAGFRPACIDLFADADLRRLCPATRAAHYPLDLPELSRTFEPSPWVYTGALENHLQVLEAMAGDRPLLGNPAAIVRQIRDPFRVWNALDEAGLPAPEVRPLSFPPEPDGKWLLKPLRSAGGRGIVRWDESYAAEAPRSLAECYFQRRLEGTLLSAVFVGDGRRAVLAGISRQWAGWRELGAAPLAYCGSIGPVPLPAPVRKRIESLGQFLAARFALIGLFGVDLMLVDGAAYPLEINPRYTASVEVLELAMRQPLMRWHVDACRGGELPPPSAIDVPRWAAKAILYASDELSCVNLPLEACRPPEEMFPDSGAWLADVPGKNAAIDAGSPICTVLAVAAGPESCLNLMAERVQQLQRELTGVAAPTDFWKAEERVLQGLAAASNV